jgi:hypothetical protein
MKMRNQPRTEERILRCFAVACYCIALTSSGVIAYALAALSLAACGDIGLSCELSTARF